MSALPIKQVLTSDVTGAWLESYDPGDRKFIKIGFLLLENGQTLSDVTIAYQTWGTLNAAGDNAILIQHAMTGWSDVPGWWPNMVGPGLAFDTNKYFVVLMLLVDAKEALDHQVSLQMENDMDHVFRPSQSATWWQARLHSLMRWGLRNIN